MAISLKDPEFDALVRRVARLGGQSLTGTIDAPIERLNVLAVFETRSEDGVPDDDATGLPS